MDNIKKITESELAEIKMLRGKFDESIYKFGTFQIEKMELDKMVSEFIEKEKNLKEEWSNLKKMEQELLDKIAKTYGDGNLDMNDGTFTPSQKPI